MNVAFLALLFFLPVVLAMSGVTRIHSLCVNAIPSHPFNGTGCGTPSYLPLEQFGDNGHSSGVLRAVQKRRKLNIKIMLRDLPRPNLVLTAWIIWTWPGPNLPKMFKIAHFSAPLAPSHAGYTSGLGREPNQFVYTSDTTAQLSVKLDFNPTYAYEGPLTSEHWCYQKDVPGIEETRYRQVPTKKGKYTPVTSYFLREYDEYGFEELGTRGRPKLVRSPVPAVAVMVVAHNDGTTHGITAGNSGGDHFEVLTFMMETPIGKPIVSKRGSLVELL